MCGLVSSQLKRLLLVFGLIGLAIAPGCATTTTTTATLSSTMSGSGASYRFQSCDVTASVQVAMTR